MDPTAVTPEDMEIASAVARWLMAYVPNGLGFSAVLALVLYVWRGARQHLCEAVPKLLEILGRLSDSFGKFADNGFAIQLDTTVHLVDERALEDTREA